MDRMSCNLRINGSAFALQVAGDEREIDFLNRASGELRGQMAMSFVVSRHNQTTTRLFVEPVHNSRPFRAADPGQICAMMKQRVDQCPIAVTCSRMNDQARWFVDYEQIVILEENVERDVLGDSLRFEQSRLCQIHEVIGPHDLSCPGRLTVYPNESAPDQLLQARSRILFKLAGHKNIKPLPRCPFRHDQVDDFLV